MEAITDIVGTVATRASTNLRGTLDNMTPEKWIRIIIIAGAYALLRPYIIKLGAKAQMRSHEAAETDEAAEAEISPNQLRGQIEIPEDTDDEEEGGAGRAGAKEETAAAVTATEWGKKARRRQRDVVKKILDAEEERLRELQEDEEDKDIEEFLVKQ